MRRSEGNDHSSRDSVAPSDVSERVQGRARKRTKRQSGKRPGSRATRKRSVKRSRPASAAKHADAGDEVAVKLADLTIVSSKRWYLTVSAALGIAGSIISATYLAIEYGKIKPVERELQESRALLTNAKADAQNFKAQLERSEQKANSLATNLERPGQVFPADLSSVVGLNVTFQWEYSKHDALSKYILELQDLSGQSSPRKFNVDRPETKSTYYAFNGTASGNYLWRVRPGVIAQGGQEVPLGPWSAPAVFAIYPSVAERIRSTGRIRVATTPTSYDPFVGVSGQGQYHGFELKLVDWLMPRVAEKLKLKQPPVPEILEIPWNRLFTYMQNGEADIAVRSITKSKVRESDYPNLRFTAGYLANHQMFVQLRKDGEYPAALKDSIVGAKSRSVNETVAKFLAPKYGFTVNSSYTAYGDLLDALRRGDIAFALVDSALVNEHLNKQVYPLGGHLDDEVRALYTRELGFDREEYAVLVHEGGSSELRVALDQTLQSEEFQSFVKAELKIK